MFDSILAPLMTGTGLFLAQPTSAPTGGGPAPGGGFPSTLLLIVIVIAIFYFVMFRDQRKKQSTRKAMLANLKKGDKVLTIGGVFGTIVNIKDSEVTIKVDESSNTKITFVRTAVDRVLSGREGAQENA